MSLNPGHSPAVRLGSARSTAYPTAKITIGELARAFNVSLRTLRFYEDRGLLVPQREGKTRYYAERDKQRLGSILRFKHLGFTLTEISDLIADSEKRAAGGGPTLRADQISAQIQYLERQRVGIEDAIQGLRAAQKALETA